MEWVETTGSSIERALDAALDELGVDEDEVEFEVLEQPKAGLFGRIGGNPARIRARVKPLSREKPGERNRGRGGRQGRRNGGRDGGRGGARHDGRKDAGRPSAPGAAGGRSSTGASDGERAGDVAGGAPSAGGESESGAGGRGVGVGGGDSARPGDGARSGRRRRKRGGSGGARSGDRPQERNDDMTTMTDDVPIGEQADTADEFMRGLLVAFGLPAEVSVTIEGDVVLVDVTGDDLGFLVGPKGATLRAVEDLVRTVVQRRTDGHGARIHVDVGGYQAKRREALARFATELAERVRSSGQELALEPMVAADRKVVHDTVAAIDGVTTASEGEDPRRRVVLRPA
ncbi:MAG: hypothetical protein AMXMBFR46_10580 [Acidimicrobiia bacterium]